MPDVSPGPGNGAANKPGLLPALVDRAAEGLTVIHTLILSLNSWSPTL